MGILSITRTHTSALVLTLALIFAPATHAADGPSFEETIGFLNSCLKNSTSGRYHRSLEVVGPHTVRMVSRGNGLKTLTNEIDFRLMDATKSLNESRNSGFAISLYCKSGDCIRIGSEKDSQYFLTDAYSDDTIFLIENTHWDAAISVLEYIFNELVPADPSAE